MTGWKQNTNNTYLYEKRPGFIWLIRIKGKMQKCVIPVLNHLELKLGKEQFTSTFKSITCDNGVEFQGFEGIEKSVFSRKAKRTNVYFVPPYSSYEQGSNENANRFIRRQMPKGSTFDKLC